MYNSLSFSRSLSSLMSIFSLIFLAVSITNAYPQNQNDSSGRRVINPVQIGIGNGNTGGSSRGGGGGGGNGGNNTSGQEEAVFLINGQTFILPVAPIWDTKPLEGISIVYSARIVSGPPGYSCFFWNPDRASGASVYSPNTQLDTSDSSSSSFSFPSSSSSSSPSSSSPVYNTFVSKTFYTNSTGLTMKDTFLNADRLTCFRRPAPENPDSHLFVWLDRSIPPYSTIAGLPIGNTEKFGKLAMAPFPGPARLERAAIVHATNPDTTCRAFYGPRDAIKQDFVEFTARAPLLKRVERALGLICFDGKGVDLGIPKPFIEPKGKT